MSYAICNVVYGVPYSYGLHKLGEKKPDEFSREVLEDKYGFEFAYSGNAEIEPGWMGVHLCEFDEASSVSEHNPMPDVASMLRLAPDEDDRERVDEMWSKLPDPIKRSVGRPDTYIIWSTS